MNQSGTKLYHSTTPEETFDGVLQNNDDVLRSLYQTVYPKVRKYIVQNNGNEDQAKDTFQEAFIATWKNVKEGKIEANGNVEAYLYAIAKNKWIDYLRSFRYKRTVSDKGIHLFENAMESESVEENMEEEAQNKSAMQKAFRKLGDECRIVLKLYYFERKSMEIISKELNIASASARNKKYRCMEKLRSLTLEIKANGR